MTKYISLLVVGAIVGGSAVFLLFADVGDETAILGPGTTGGAPTPRDPTALAATIAKAAEDAASVQNTNELGRLVAELAGLDLDAAVASVGKLAPGAGQRAAALAVLAAIGIDEAGIARVAAVLPAGDRFAFRADALASLAEHDLAGALALASTWQGDSLKRNLLLRVGEGAARAARADPVAALAAAATIGDLNLRSGFTLGILNSWAALDPVGMLAWLETADPDTIRAPVSFDRLVIGDPEGVLDRLDDFSPEIRPSVQRAARICWASDLRSADCCGRHSAAGR